MPTAGDLRSNAERIADEQLKERILRGIAVLEEVVGPDWPDKVDPMTLSMQSPRFCVLGQVFDGAPLTVDQELQVEFVTATGEGFFRGLVIIDGEVEKNPARFGFDRYGLGTPDYDELDRAWTSLWD